MMKSYIKITTLSPLHIGAGEDFVPTGYIIDREILYEFGESDFYQALASVDKKAFVAVASHGLHALKRFYENHKDIAKKLAFREIPVSKEIAERYKKQYNKDGSLNNNRLEIAKCMYQGVSHLPYIPGSSLKGVIETALGIYVEKGSNEERQNLQISDFFTDTHTTVCGFAMRRHKQKETRGNGIPVMVEAVRPNTAFFGTIASEKKGLSDKVFEIEKIGSSLESFAKNADPQMFEDYQKNAPKGGYIFRIGRFVGQNFTAVGLKKRPVTHSLFTMDKIGYIPFGWVHMEIISENAYGKAVESFIENTQKSSEQIVSLRMKWEEERKKRQREKEERARKLAEEEERKLEEERRAAERLAAMSPAERLVEMHETSELIQMMQNGVIEDYEKIKLELAQKIKEVLQQDPKKWDKAKKKALKRKEFIQSILGEK
jgi:hypothetical protein